MYRESACDLHIGSAHVGRTEPKKQSDRGELVLWVHVLERLVGAQTADLARKTETEQESSMTSVELARLVKGVLGALEVFFAPRNVQADRYARVEVWPSLLLGSKSVAGERHNRWLREYFGGEIHFGNLQAIRAGSGQSAVDESRVAERNGQRA